MYREGRRTGCIVSSSRPNRHLFRFCKESPNELRAQGIENECTCLENELATCSFAIVGIRLVIRSTVLAFGSDHDEDDNRLVFVSYTVHIYIYGGVSITFC